MPRPPSDEDLDELPPLDGDAREREPEPDFSDLIDEPKREEEASDDDTPEPPVDASEIDSIDEREGSWLNEGADAKDLDLGSAQLIDFADAEGSDAAGIDEGSDGPAVGQEDFGLGSDADDGPLDADLEGPADADEELREEDLPALDADEDGEVGDAPLVEPGFADEPLAVEWAAEPWPRVGAPIALVNVSAVACAGRGVLAAAGGEMARVDLEGACERVEAKGLGAGETSAIAAEGDRVAAIVGGQLFVSHDGGARFERVALGLEAADVAIASGVSWVRGRAGALLCETTLRALPGAATAMVRDARDGVVVLVADDAGRVAAIARGGAKSGSVERETVDAPDARVPAVFAARAGHVAWAARRGGVVRGAAGKPVESIVWEGRVTAMTFVDDAGTLVAATWSDSEDTTALVRVDAKGGVSVVARVGGTGKLDDSDGRATALAYDDARGVVWVAGSFGIAAFEVR